MALILGIETSCDETSAAVVADGRDVRSNVVSSQVDLHRRYGGVVPEIAARAHVEQIDGVIQAALDDAGCTLSEVDAIAVSDGPGLVGALLVGVTAAKTLAATLDVPLVAVDHVAAHATSPMLASDADAGAPWPLVALVVSGGHTSLYHVRDPLQIELLGQTVDDAAGEAFDKVAALLELGFPGGPAVDRLAQSGDPRAIEFPRTWIKSDHLDFSFSGLKTAVMYRVYGVGNKYGDVSHLSARDRADIAASFQAALVETLVAKTITAAKSVRALTVGVGGGVAANAALRAALAAACRANNLRLILTPLEYCTDNAAMIAALAFPLWRAGRTAALALEPRSGLLRPARS